MLFLTILEKRLEKPRNRRTRHQTDVRGPCLGGSSSPLGLSFPRVPGPDVLTARVQRGLRGVQASRLHGRSARSISQSRAEPRTFHACGRAKCGSSPPPACFSSPRAAGAGGCLGGLASFPFFGTNEEGTAVGQEGVGLARFAHPESGPHKRHGTSSRKRGRRLLKKNGDAEGCDLPGPWLGRDRL